MTRMQWLVASVGVVGVVTGIGIATQLNLTPPAETAPSSQAPMQVGGVSLPDFTRTAERVTPAVVSIEMVKIVRRPNVQLDPFFGLPMRGQDAPQRQAGEGSGVIVDPSGIVITNNHVAGDADRLRVRLNDKRVFEAKVVGTDPNTDLAVIRLEGAKDLPVAKWGDSGKLKVGEWVLAIGNPFGFSATVTAGIVSALGRSNVHIADFEDFIQTDAAINPGNSGGALVNQAGEVVGINTAIASRGGGSNGIGFAIPSNMVQRIMDLLIKEGKVIRGYIGIGLQPMDEMLAETLSWKDRGQGIVVGSVEPNTPGRSAGLETGDVIVKLNGRVVTEPNTFRNEVALTRPGTEVVLDIWRKGQNKQIKVRLAERPGQPSENRQAPEKGKPAVGLDVEDLNPEIARQIGIDPRTRGAVVTAVEPGSAAEEAGIEPGEVVLEVNRNRVRDAREFQAEVLRLKAGQSIMLLLQKGGGTRLVAFRVG